MRLGLLAACILSQTLVATASTPVKIHAIVTRAVDPMMRQYAIPGMAIGVTANGRHYVFNYGVASKVTRSAVDDRTLFEIGSITKTFTASLATYAQITGKLSLSDAVSADFPMLRGTSFDKVQIVNLATHTSGGLPLQFPDDVQNETEAIAFYKQWKASYPPGTQRLYSNTGVMLLGLVTAYRMHADFAMLMQSVLFTPLGLRSTFLNLPANQLSRYAQGYSGEGKPRRMIPGPLAAEAYGVRTTASDMLRFLDANMRLIPLNPTLQRAIVETHTGYYQLGNMIQDLAWEQYRYPVSLPALLQGNSDNVIFVENPVAQIQPPMSPLDDVLINKTGSTAGFAAYVAFIPRRKIGIVLLANRAYPISARVTAAYQILSSLLH